MMHYFSIACYLEGGVVYNTWSCTLVSTALTSKTMTTLKLFGCVYIVNM